MDTKTFTHALTGESITFLETTPQHTFIEVTLPPFGDGPPLHKHDRYEEQFTVLAGTLTVVLGKQKHRLAAGSKKTVPLKQNHRFTNESAEPVTFRVLLTPQCDFESSVRIHYGLLEDGLTDSKGNPKDFTYTALILFAQNTWIAGIPIALQRLLSKAIIRRGYKKHGYKDLQKYLHLPVEKLLP